MYTATSIDVFIAAYAGCLGGMRSGRGVSQNTNPAHYVHMCNVALAFAESFDTEYASVLPNDLQLADIESVCSEQMNGRQPGGVPPTTPAFWTKPVLAIIALLTEADSIVAANVTNPIPFPAPPSGIPVIQIATIVGATDSLASTTPTTGIAAIVDGYHVRGDDGGGFVYWDTTSIAADNRGTIINPTGHIGAGRWIRIISGTEISVKWFGATGDGVTDDRPAINECMVYLSSLITQTTVFPQRFTGATAFFPNGIYAVSAEPGFPHCIELPSSTNMRGEHATCIRPTVATGNTVALLITGLRNNCIRDIQFAGGYSQIQICGPTANFGLFPAFIGIEQMNVIERCEFNNCPGPAIWQNMSPISNPGNYRSFTGPLVISHCRFYGPCFFWGTGDNVEISSNQLNFDQTNFNGEPGFPSPYPSSADGLPLGLINQAGNLRFNNNTIELEGPGGGKPPNPAQQCIIVGAGETQADRYQQFDNGSVFYRKRTLANTFQGPLAEAPQSLSSAVLVSGSLHMSGSLVSCNNVNFIEIYESMLREIKLENNVEFNTNLAFGIWINADDISITDLVTAQVSNQLLRFDNFITQLYLCRTSAGVDYNLPAGSAGVTDLTGVLTAYRYDMPYEEDIIEETPAENLFPPNIPIGLTAGAGNVFPTGVHQALVGSDAGLGFTLATQVANANSASLNITTSDTFWGGALPAGLYTFSFYFLATFDGTMALALVLPAPANGATLINKRFSASSTYQRIWVTFYHDGTAKGFTAAISNVNSGLAWTPGAWMINRGTKPAPYVHPLGSTVVITGAVPPADPVTANGFTQSWLRSRYYLKSTPVAGVFNVGDIVQNIAPADTGFIGFVCTTEGAIGGTAVFKGFGYIGTKPGATQEAGPLIQFFDGTTQIGVLQNVAGGFVSFIAQNAGNYFTIINPTGGLVLKSGVAGPGNQAIYDIDDQLWRDHTGGNLTLRITSGSLGFYGHAVAAQQQITNNTGDAGAATQVVDVTTGGLADPAKINANFAALVVKLQASGLLKN